MAKDYYQILGVDRKADEKEIKKAYRKKAREYHPDANKGADAETRFKEISAAYQVLSDKEKRDLYDQFGDNYDKVAQGAPPPGAGGVSYGPSAGQNMGGVNFEDLLNQARRQGANIPGGQGGNVQSEEDLGDIFGSIFGGLRGNRGSTQSGQPGGFNFRQRRAAKGQDVEQPLEISLGESIKGTQRGLQLIISDPATGQRHTRNVTVKIPAGVREGSRVRAAKQGAPGVGGGPNGDLYLRIRIGKHPFWKREGDNLRCEIPITYAEAALGETINVPTLTGEIKMKIPAGTQSGLTFRLSGRGVPHHKGGKSGDEFVTVKVAVPKDLQPREEELIGELAALRDQSVRGDLKTKV